MARGMSGRGGTGVTQSSRAAAADPDTSNPHHLKSTTQLLGPRAWPLASSRDPVCQIDARQLVQRPDRIMTVSAASLWCGAARRGREDQLAAAPGGARRASARARRPIRRRAPALAVVVVLQGCAGLRPRLCYSLHLSSGLGTASSGVLPAAACPGQPLSPSGQPVSQAQAAPPPPSQPQAAPPAALLLLPSCGYHAAGCGVWVQREIDFFQLALDLAGRGTGAGSRP
jgi:hypothetical protein